MSTGNYPTATQSVPTRFHQSTPRSPGKTNMKEALVFIKDNPGFTQNNQQLLYFVDIPARSHSNLASCVVMCGTSLQHLCTVYKVEGFQVFTYTYT